MFCFVSLADQLLSVFSRATVKHLLWERSITAEVFVLPTSVSVALLAEVRSSVHMRNTGLCNQIDAETFQQTAQLGTHSLREKRTKLPGCERGTCAPSWTDTDGVLLTEAGMPLHSTDVTGKRVNIHCALFPMYGMFCWISLADRAFSSFLCRNKYAEKNRLPKKTHSLPSSVLSLIFSLCLYAHIGFFTETQAEAFPQAYRSAQKLPSACTRSYREAYTCSHTHVTLPNRTFSIRQSLSGAFLSGF